MYHLNKKQKIILGILVTIITGFVYYYVYAKEGNNTVSVIENSLEIQSDRIEQQEEYNNDKILVHISGAVKKEGVVELKKDSRIADAIEKARRNQGRSIYERY